MIVNVVINMHFLLPIRCQLGLSSKSNTYRIIKRSTKHLKGACKTTKDREAFCEIKSMHYQYRRKGLSKKYSAKTFCVAQK